MKDLSIKEVLFFIAFAIIIAAGIGLTYKNKSKDLKPTTSSNSSMNSISTRSDNTSVGLSSNTAAFAPGAVKYQNFAMPEPFAATAPFEFTPVAWMQVMNNMMNNIQMTQMMHQMAAMPMQMMQSDMWANPHARLPNSTTHSSQPPVTPQQPMDPKEYKKWYELQLKHQQSIK